MHFFLSILAAPAHRNQHMQVPSTQWQICIKTKSAHLLSAMYTRSVRIVTQYSCSIAQSFSEYTRHLLCPTQLLRAWFCSNCLRAKLSYCRFWCQAFSAPSSAVLAVPLANVGRKSAIHQLSAHKHQYTSSQPTSTNTPALSPPFLPSYPSALHTLANRRDLQ